MSMTGALFSAANDNFPGFYVYIWRRPNGEPFYVGKGKGKRAHNTTGRSKEFKEVYSVGGCAVEIVDWFIHESQAHAHEIELIALYGRRDMGGLLVNKTDGGEGASGLSHPPEARAKISASLLGNTRTLGYRHSDEAKAKMSDAQAGKVRSADHRAKIGDAHRGKIVSQETRAILRDSNLGRTHSARTRAKMSDVRRGKPLSAHHAARISEALTGRVFDGDWRSKIRDAKRAAPPKDGFKGVRLRAGSWIASINTDGKGRHIGAFSTPEEAARAYDDAIARF